MGVVEAMVALLTIALGIIGYFVKGLIAEHQKVKIKLAQMETTVEVQKALIASQDSTIQEVRSDLKELLNGFSEIKAQIAGICRRSDS